MANTREAVLSLRIERVLKNILSEMAWKERKSLNSLMKGALHEFIEKRGHSIVKEGENIL